jgi:hypothetical protein
MFLCFRRGNRGALHRLNVDKCDPFDVANKSIVLLEEGSLSHEESYCR